MSELPRPSDDSPWERLVSWLGILSDGTHEAARLGHDAARELADTGHLQALTDAIALVQDLRRRLGDLERDVTLVAAEALPRDQRAGNLSDGRQWSLHRTADRKAWDHESWKHDARREVVRSIAHADDVAVDGATGEARPLRSVLFDVATRVQEVAGAGPPRTGQLKALGLDPSDYCSTTYGSWKLDAIAPTETVQEN